MKIKVVGKMTKARFLPTGNYREAGWCWGCGDNTPVFNGDEDAAGLCHDCRAADEMHWRTIRRFA